jgi:hypothetical protein
MSDEKDLIETVKQLRAELETEKRRTEIQGVNIERMRTVAWIRQYRRRLGHQHQSVLADIAKFIARGVHRKENDNE